MILWIVFMSDLLWTFSGLSASAEDVTGLVNGSVTLPCHYSTSKGTYNMCWGRGECSHFYCNERILETDGRKVTWRKSDRYQLRGDISQRDVSMTITGATKEDEGSYCCRVEIPGWFNDKVTYVTLKIEKDRIHEDSSDLPTNPPTHWTITISPQVLILDKIHEDSSDLPTNPPTHCTITISAQTFSSNSESESTRMETYVLFSFVTLAVILLAAILYIYKFKKKKADVRTEHTELNNLSSPANQMAENFYIMD